MKIVNENGEDADVRCLLREGGEALLPLLRAVMETYRDDEIESVYKRTIHDVQIVVEQLTEAGY